MKIGKVPNSVLEDLISNIKSRDEVIVGSCIGKDTAILDFKDKLLVLSTDPITGANKDLGNLAINVAVNDLATEGAEPVAAMLTILAPPGTTEDDLKVVMDEAKESASRLNMAIVGGHTEITDAVNRIVVSTAVLGSIEKPFTKKEIEVNDVLVLTKSIGIEGTSIIAKEKEEDLSKILNNNEIEEAISYSKMTSVVEEGVLGKKYGAKYMHDITEGGILGAAWEAAKANNIGLVVFDDRIPISSVTKKISDHYNIDPRRLISSGSLMMIISQQDLLNLIPKLEEKDISISVIGRVTDYEGVFLKENGKMIPLPEPKPDELYKVIN